MPDDHDYLPTLFTDSTERATVHIEVGARTCWVRGAGVTKLARELDIPVMRDWEPSRRGTFMLPVDRVGDLLALLEHRDRRNVELTAVDR